MSDTFIWGACLIGVILAVAWAWADYIEKKDLTSDDFHPDDIDMRVWRLKNERRRQNKCVYCGNPLDPARCSVETVCADCAPDLPDF